MNSLSFNFKSLVALYESCWKRIIQASELSDQAIRVFRILLPAVYLLLYMPDYNWISTMPNAWYDPAPLSVAIFLNEFPPLWFFQLTQTLLIVSAALLICGYRPRFSGLLFCALHIVITSFEYSFGKIDHVAHLFLLCFFSFSLGHWGSAPINDRFKLPIPCSTLLAVLLSFGMFTAGFEKSLKWLDFDMNTSGFLSWYFSGYYNLGRDAFLAPYITNLPKLALECMDYSAVLFELSPFICLLLGKRFWIAWCIVACSFHAGTTLLLNIAFPYQLFGYLPFLVPAVLFARINLNIRTLILSALVLVSLRLAPVWFEGLRPLRTVLFPTATTELCFDLCVWITLIALGGFKLYLMGSGASTMANNTLILDENRRLS